MVNISTADGLAKRYTGCWKSMHALGMLTATNFGSVPWRERIYCTNSPLCSKISRLPAASILLTHVDIGVAAFGGGVCREEASRIHLEDRCLVAVARFSYKWIEMDQSELSIFQILPGIQERRSLQKRLGLGYIKALRFMFCLSLVGKFSIKQHSVLLFGLFVSLSCCCP